MPRLILLVALALAACGADGEPQPPGKSGITFGGEVKMGIGSN